MCEKLGQTGKYSIHYLIVADKQRKQPKHRASTRPYILHGLECSLKKIRFCVSRWVRRVFQCYTILSSLLNIEFNSNSAPALPVIHFQ